MKTRTKLIAVICAFIVGFTGMSSGFAAVDQDVSDIYPTAEPSPMQLEQEAAPPEIADQFELRGYVDIQQGYDNNVDLDSQRHKDGFLQILGNLEALYKPTDKVDVRAGSYIFTTIYYKYNVDNLLNVGPYFSIDIDVTPDLIWKNEFTYDYFSYPNDKESTFHGIKYTTFLRQYFLPDVYHEVGADLIKRWFPDRKVSLDSAQIGGKDREDGRFRMQYNIAGFFYDAFIRVSNEYSRNNSNYEFQQYYDWHSYRLRPSIMYFFTDEFYVDLALTYRYRAYKDRRNTESPNDKVRNHTYTFTSSAYYDITKNITLGFTYSYSENLSNDPYETYSGSVMSGGLYYSF